MRPIPHSQRLQPIPLQACLIAHPRKTHGPSLTPLRKLAVGPVGNSVESLDRKTDFGVIDQQQIIAVKFGLDRVERVACVPSSIEGRPNCHPVVDLKSNN